MKSKLLYFFIALFFILAAPSIVKAADCNTGPNNIFGIHLAQPETEDIEDAASLVNSSGGKWGYVTLVIQQDDRNQEKWQGVFNDLRKKHLIPIIRLATKPEGDNWRRVTAEEVDAWVEFLNSLNWVVKDRYVILFNEPNHASEWGGVADPINYATVSYDFATKLKKKNKDFFIMLAGLDTSAPQSPPSFFSSTSFIKIVLQTKPDIFDYIDGLSSHSYPNPGFVGSYLGVGPKSVRGYIAELAYLKELGVKRELAVFITETGWPHREGVNENKNFPSSDAVADIFTKYYQSIANDRQICAITPFILNYQTAPFDHFSWRKLGKREFYPQYQSTAAIEKIAGEPNQNLSVSAKASFPDRLTQESIYDVKIELINGPDSEVILDRADGLRIAGIDDKDSLLCSDIAATVPNQAVQVGCSINTGHGLGQKSIKLGLYKNDKLVSELLTWQYELVPLPDLSFQIGKLGIPFKGDNDNSNFEVQIFDKNEKMVFRRTNIEVKNGQGVVTGIGNVALDQEYRVVILKPYYLPVQDFIVIKEGVNSLSYKIMIPFDRDLDGRFTIKGDVLGISTEKD